MKVRKTKAPKTTANVYSKSDENSVVFVSADEARKVAGKLGLPGGPLSYTQISTYLICPQTYKIQYVEKLRRTGWSDNLFFGSAVHTGLEFLNKARMYHADLNKKLLTDACSACSCSLLENIKNTPGLSPPEISLIHEKEKLCYKILAAWFETYLPKINVQGAEKKLYALANGIPLVLIIDLIDDNVIKDFKVSRKAKSIKDAEDSLQLTLYAAIIGASKSGFITCPFPDLSKKNYDPMPKEVVVEKNTGEKQWAFEMLGSLFKTIVASTHSGAFNYCDPASWKCSEAFCDWWPRCRGKFVKTRPPVGKPAFMKTKKRK